MATASKKSVGKKTGLKQDIVIEKIEGQSTGAQAIAPDHSPTARSPSG